YEDYDLYGNPQTIKHQLSSSQPVVSHQTFDVRSRITSVADDLRPTEAFTYDALDRLIRRTATDPAGIRDPLSSTMTYLPEGQLKSVTQAGGQTMSAVNEYDGLSRVRQTTETPKGVSPIVRTFVYDRNSNLTEETDRRGVVRTRTYDELNFITSETLAGPYGATLATMTAPEIDKVGNPKRVQNLYGQTI